MCLLSCGDCYTKDVDIASREHFRVECTLKSSYLAHELVPERFGWSASRPCSLVRSLGLGPNLAVGIALVEWQTVTFHASEGCR